MDEIDGKILSALEKDSRTPFVEIAKKAGLTEGAVRKRVKDLASEGVIKKFTIVVDAGKKLKALSIVNVATSKPMQAISGKIRRIENVSEVFEVSGEFDIVVFIEGNSPVEINKTVDKVRAIEGVLKTDTVFVLH